MIGALTMQPQYLSGIRRDAAGPSAPAPRVVDPWQGFRGADAYRPSEPLAPPTPVPESPPPLDVGGARGLLKKIVLAAMAVTATVGAGTAILTAAPQAAEAPAMSQVVEGGARTEAHGTLPTRSPLEQALLQTDPHAPIPFWSDTWAASHLVRPSAAPLHTEPFSLLRGDSVTTYDARGRQFDLRGNPVPSKPAESPSAQPMHRSYPRPKVQKGDYVAHGVNFSALLSNEEFTDAQSMTQADIQALLEKNESFLASFTQDGRPASQIIYDAAVQHRINPRVILATLEKENSLVSRTSRPADWVLRSAMGYAYDDGGSTAGRHSNFAYQVDRGTGLLRSLYDEGVSQSLPSTMRVDYGHRKVRVDNAATWALMRYTPHTRDTQMRHVGGGNYLFNSVMKRVNAQAEQLERAPADTLRRT